MLRLSRRKWRLRDASTLTLEAGGWLECWRMKGETREKEASLFLSQFLCCFKNPPCSSSLVILYPASNSPLVSSPDAYSCLVPSLGHWSLSGNNSPPCLATKTLSKGGRATARFPLASLYRQCCVVWTRSVQLLHEVPGEGRVSTLAHCSPSLTVCLSLL